MAKIYYELIKKELRTINDVPIRWRDDVQTLIEADTVQ
ncbi:CD1375 family protein [Cytobacillus sp. IB215316]|nr:CD1375 family protein [Cytobacillus sp. IB215316]MDX8359833.1 CD1375 family protein [Cytobacillus sp. IB215316]